jgi:hypothetical protein
VNWGWFLYVRWGHLALSGGLFDCFVFVVYKIGSHPDWPGTPDIPALASWVLGLQVWATMPDWEDFFITTCEGVLLHLVGRGWGSCEASTMHRSAPRTRNHLGQNVFGIHWEVFINPCRTVVLRCAASSYHGCLHIADSTNSAQCSLLRRLGNNFVVYTFRCRIIN